MSGGKGGGDSTTVQKADPWSGQQPYLKYGFEQAQNLYNSGGPKFYPGATYVPFSGQTEQALGMAQNRAGGSAAEQSLGGYLNNSLQGNYLNNNPWLDSMYGHAAGQMTDQFQNAVMPSINATFGGAGRTGSGIHGQTVSRSAGELGDSLAGLSANIYGGNYQSERDRMTQAAGLVPTSSALDWQNISKMGQVGQTVEGKAGEVLSDSMSRFNHYQSAPEQNLARYIAAIQGNYGGTSSTQSETQGNPVAGALGGGLLGYGLGSALPSIGSSMGLMLGSAAWPLALGGALAGGLFS